MGNELVYQIQMSPEVSTYFYARFHEYLEQNPDEKDILTYGAYLGQVVLSSLKSLFEGKVPEIYVPTKEGE